MLRDTEYDKYKTRKKDLLTDAEYARYIDNPSSHPKYETVYQDFIEMYLDEYHSLKNKDRVQAKWKRFWCSYLDKKRRREEGHFSESRDSHSSKYRRKESDDFKTNTKSETSISELLRDHSKNYSESIESYKKSTKPMYYHDHDQLSTSNRKFSVENTLDMLQDFSCELGKSSNYFRDMIDDLRRVGVDKYEGRQIMNNSDNKLMFEMAIDRCKDLRRSRRNPEKYNDLLINLAKLLDLVSEVRS